MRSLLLPLQSFLLVPNSLTAVFLPAARSRSRKSEGRRTVARKSCTKQISKISSIQRQQYLGMCKRRE